MASPDEVEEVLKRIINHPGVTGSIITNPEGVAIRSTMDNSTTQIYLSNIQSMTQMARSAVRDLDPLNDLKFLRIRSRKYEILVAPENDYTLIVIQSYDAKD
ncbi:predicted protein [Nematostella vectensis]|uniref:Dynein light chain roadblock n=1 Tax=Nematostella vectensis TaxID=45351 RepID=A7RRW8_NEMVE|nr:predicted protein [Nematostella vectensis]|eukprot:XP_001637961.1 predicted protein [Nematostella vectensis]